MEAGLRVMLPAGDYLMGQMGNTKLKDTDPTPCCSGRQTEDLTLEFPANRTLARLPADADVKTANLHFTPHWALNGQTLSVHREFVSMIDQPLCAGDVRKETASALAQIRRDYTVPISLAMRTAAPVSATFAVDDKTVAPAPAESPGEWPIEQSGLATSESAPHIDSLTLSEQSGPNGISIAQEFVFHSPKGNGAMLHFDLVSSSSPAPDVRFSDWKVMAAEDLQRRGAVEVTRTYCQPVRMPYSVVRQAVLIDTDGEKSNTVDYTIHCPGSPQ
jgi:hypothetical protein